MTSIVLVDDDRNILTSLRMVLETEGYNIRTFNDGLSALEFYPSGEKEASFPPRNEHLQKAI